MKVGFQYRQMYEPTWLGVPIIQFPGDMVMLAELIWKLKPDIIIETGVAHGGSAIFFASILELIGKGRVVAIDVEIRQYNRIAIQAHQLSKRIQLIEKDSLDRDLETILTPLCEEKTTMVFLDSSHSYEHVLEEMDMYGRYVTAGSYMVVMDGIQQNLSDTPRGNPEWIDDNPLRAIHKFLETNSSFWRCDRYYERLLITCAPHGFLQKTSID